MEVRKEGRKEGSYQLSHFLDTAPSYHVKNQLEELHHVQKKGATNFFAVTFTNIDGLS